MSSSSSNKRARQLIFIIALFAWVIVGFFVAQYLVVFLARAMLDVTGYTYVIGESPLLQLVVSAAAYVVALGVIVGVPKLLFEAKKESLWQELGIEKKPHITLVAYALLGYAVYFLLTIIFGLVAQAVWREFPVDQAQQVGFGNLASIPEYMMAFVALVVIPPIAEELLFRGYFYSKIRTVSKFWVSAVITSLLFGLVHWQWNVGVDVFALSLVLCALREYTGTIWAGVGVHLIKNTVAFAILFFMT